MSMPQQPAISPSLGEPPAPQVRARARTWGGPRTLKDAQRRFVFLGLTPILLLFGLLSLLPIALTVWLSFFSYDGLSAHSPFVGLGNYVHAITDDDEFRRGLWNSVRYAVVAVPFNVCLSLPVALGLLRIKRLSGLFRTAFFAPVTVSAVAVALLWVPMYDPQHGWINAALAKIGIAGPAWLAEPSTALWSVMVASVWQDLPYNIIVFLAGLSAIPAEFYEACRLDGAGAWRTFTSITLPLLRPTLLFVSVLTLTSYIQQFTQVQVMTNGGPIGSSETLVLYIYNKSFHDYQMGYASAMAVIFLLIMLVITVLQLRFLRSRWEY